MNELQPDQSYGLSYDETLFLTYQKIPKVKIQRWVVSIDYPTLYYGYFKVVAVGIEKGKIFKIKRKIAE